MTRRALVLWAAIVVFVGSGFRLRGTLPPSPRLWRTAVASAEAGRRTGGALAEAVGGTSVADAGRSAAGRGDTDRLPDRLSDEEFWKMLSELSEPSGNFRSDNLLSNEIRFQTVIPGLTRAARQGGVYMGVGPEQNFTYVAALRPRLAFIIDVRRGNVDLHLLYKALFDLSIDRADFVSRLFSRTRPAGLGATSSAAQIFDAFAGVEPSERFYTGNLAAIRDQLVTQHRFALTGDDLSRIESIFHVFYLSGTRIQYSPYGSFGGTVQPTYADLMAATDDTGQARGYLASEQSFAFIKDFERRNALLPIVGDFGGPKAVRAIGEYLRRHGATVSAFYVSNVEEYLRQDRVWQDFCANVATLPVHDASTFIRAVRGATYDGFVLQLAPIAAEVRLCTPAAGQ